MSFTAWRKATSLVSTTRSVMRRPDGPITASVQLAVCTSIPMYRCICVLAGESCCKHDHQRRTHLQQLRPELADRRDAKASQVDSDHHPSLITLAGQAGAPTSPLSPTSLRPTPRARLAPFQADADQSA